MSINYNQPQSGAIVNVGFANNPSLTPGTISALNTILGIQSPASQVSVGNFDGTILISPPNPSLVITNLGGSITDPIYSMRNTIITSSAQGLIFDSNRSIEALFDSRSPLAQSSHSANSSHGIDRVVSSGNGNDILSFVDDGNTTVDGSAGNDSITTSGGNDSITGGTGNDTIAAGFGNDTIVTGVGADTVNGGAGFDVIQLSGSPINWTESVVNNSRVVITSTSSSGNTVSATNVEFISFTGATGSQYSIVISGTENEATTMRLYQGLFDRSADQGGAQYWQAQVREGASTVAIANEFLATPEYVNAYGNQTNTQYITQLYENTFNRAPDAAGLAYWLGTLANGASKGGVAIAIVGSPEAVADVTNVILVPGLI